MIRSADGDRSAFQRLFDGLWPVLLAFTTRTLPSRADAEDAARQAILKVFSRSVAGALLAAPLRWRPA